VRGSNPCLPAKFEARLGLLDKLRIHKHFVTLEYSPHMREEISQPDRPFCAVFRRRLIDSGGE